MNYRFVRDGLEMDEAELRNLKIIEAILGQKFRDHAVMLFTYGTQFRHHMQTENPDRNLPDITYQQFVESKAASRNTINQFLTQI